MQQKLFIFPSSNPIYKIISITEFKFIQLIFDKYGKIIKTGMHSCTEHTCPKFNMKRKIMISYENVIFF